MIEQYVFSGFAIIFGIILICFHRKASIGLEPSMNSLGYRFESKLIEILLIIMGVVLITLGVTILYVLR